MKQSHIRVTLGCRTVTVGSTLLTIIGLFQLLTYPLRYCYVQPWWVAQHYVDFACWGIYNKEYDIC